MNQVLFEDEDRNKPRGLLYDIQGERVKTLFTILTPDISIFVSSLSSLLTFTRVCQEKSGRTPAIMNSPNWIFLMPESHWLKRS